MEGSFFRRRWLAVGRSVASWLERARLWLVWLWGGDAPLLPGLTAFPPPPAEGRVPLPPTRRLPAYVSHPSQLLTPRRDGHGLKFAAVPIGWRPKGAGPARKRRSRPLRRATKTGLPPSRVPMSGGASSALPLLHPRGRPLVAGPRPVRGWPVGRSWGDPEPSGASPVALEADPPFPPQPS